MAKELSIKVKIDGEEIDIAKKSTKELTDQIGALKDKLGSIPMGSAEFKKVQGDIDNLEKGFTKAKNATQPFLESMSQLPGVAGLAGQSIKGLKGGMDLLAENPLIAIFTLLATIVLKVADKMKDLEGVMDPLEKITSIFSGVMSVLANTILPPVAALLEGIAEGASKVANFFGGLIGVSQKVGDNMSYVAETMDNLKDTNAEFAVSQAAANRQLQEAREIAGDATKSVAERVKALKDAEVIERDIAEKARQRQMLEARARAVELAVSLGYNDEQIEAIKKYDAIKLASFAKEIQGLKGLNREKSDQLFQNLGNIEESGAQEARIAKKTESQIRSVENEGHTKSIEAAKKAAEEKKDYEKRLADFKLDTRLQGIKDEQEKARVSLENDKQKTLAEIDTLQMSVKRKNELKKAAEEDYAAKEKVLLEKQHQDRLKEEQDFNNKVRDIQIAAESDELQRNIDTRTEKYNRDVAAMQKDKEFLKKNEQEKANILKDMETAKNVDINKIKEDNAKKEAELIYKRIEFERQSRLMEIQSRMTMIDIEHKTELEKIEERRQLLQEQAQIDRDKEIENLDKLHTAKEVNDKDYNDRKVALEQKYNVTIAKTQLDSEKQILEARKKNLDAINQLGTSIGQLGEAMGKETAAGQALIRVQQALALATTAVAIAHAFSGLGKSLDEPFPANVIAVASTLALIATGIQQFKALTSPIGPIGNSSSAPSTTPQSGGRNYADGGMIEGPSHAQGGVNVNAQGGEAVMTRGAVTSFGPLLSMLNQMGGGTSFVKGAIGQAYSDNPQLKQPSQEQPIFKTYVVENELTTIQHKNARLKDLSTL